MSQAHLSTERLQALHDGEPGHRRELGHLASCPVCQEAFDDTRWTMLLMRLRAAKAEAGDHPDRDELLAYLTGTLATARQASILEHLSSCHRCLIECARTRAGRKQARYSSPPRKIVQATMAQFRPRKLRRLGRLLVERVGEGLALTFLRRPDPITESGLSALVETDRHPASVSRRVMRLRMMKVEDQSRDLELDACEMTGAAPPPADAFIEAAPWSLRIGPTSDTPDDSLQVTLASADETRSPAEIKMRIVSERGGETSAATDARGVAAIRCPSGSSRLIVEVDPPLSVEIRFDD